MQSPCICLWRLHALSAILLLFIFLTFAIAVISLRVQFFSSDMFCFQICQIVPGQRYTKMLNGRQVTEMLKATCQRPVDREKSIVKACIHQIYITRVLVAISFTCFLTCVLISVSFISCRL